MKSKILIFDIETAPLVGYAWQPYDTNLIEVIEDWKLLSISWKWLGEKKVHVYTSKTYPNDRAITKVMWKILDQAEVVVAQNGDKFDIKKVMAKFAEHKILPPKPFKSVDTRKICKRRFGFTSNSLEGIARILGIKKKKVRHSGFDMWKGVMAHDPKFIKEMGIYNAGDVTLLEECYIPLQPWDNQHPNVVSPGLCQHQQLQSRGYALTKTSTYQRFQCRGCGKWLRNRVAEKTLKPAVVNL